MEKYLYGDQAPMHSLKVEICLSLIVRLSIILFLILSLSLPLLSLSFSLSLSPSLSLFFSLSLSISISLFNSPILSFSLPRLESDKLDVLQTCYNNPASWNIRQGTFGADSVGQFKMTNSTDTVFISSHHPFRFSSSFYLF